MPSITFAVYASRSDAWYVAGQFVVDNDGHRSFHGNKENVVEFLEKTISENDGPFTDSIATWMFCLSNSSFATNWKTTVRPAVLPVVHISRNDASSTLYRRTVFWGKGSIYVVDQP